jgi:hypothetical protein
VNKVILNWQRPLWEGDSEVVKRSGRDEPMWVAIHKYMEAMLGISLYSYLCFKLAECCLSYYLLGFLFNKIREQGQILPESGGGLGGQVAQTMCTSVSECNNYKK